MSFLQNALQWIAEEAFPIVVVFCCLVIAYMVYAAVFRKRVLPTLLNRRVNDILLTPSGTRKAYESGSRPATTSGSRPVAPISSVPPDLAREAPSPKATRRP